MLTAVLVTAGLLGLMNGSILATDAVAELALGARREQGLWRALLRRREETWVNRLPGLFSRLNVPRPTTAAWLFELVAGTALFLGGLLAFASL